MGYNEDYSTNTANWDKLDSQANYLYTSNVVIPTAITATATAPYLATNYLAPGTIGGNLIGTAAGGIAGQVLLISAFTCGVNFICGIYPEATNMAMCEMTGTSYPTYLKTMLKTLVPMLVVAAIIISVAPYVGLV